jgi:Mrp family chromosome partitioning ATPase/capsular polysaccharide biosynthesis protein
MEPRESTFEPTVIGAIWRYRALFGAIVAACIVLGVVFSALQPKEWSAVATLVVEDPRASSLFEQPVSGTNADRYVENQVAVLRSQTIAQEVIGSPAVVALADPMDLTEFARRLTVGSSPGSDVLTVEFIAGDPDVALASVNAVTEAYQSVLEDEATSTFAAAVEELGTSIERWRSDLDQIQADIAAFTAADPSRAALADQYRASLERLVELQAELPTADAERSGQIRLELDDIAKSFATLQQLDAIEQESPELRALLEQQSEAVRQLSALAVLRDELSVDAELAGSGVVVVSPAEEVVPVTTGMARAAAVSLVIGVMIGAAVAYVLALRTQTFDDRLQPEAILEAGLLAEVPSFTEAGLRTQLPVRDAASTSTAEAYRFLATALEMRSRAGGPVVDGDGAALSGGSRSFVVVSAEPGDGKTVTAANIALAAARDGFKVLAVDADFDDQALTRLLVGTESPRYGLPELVGGRITLERVLEVIEFDVDRIAGHRTMPGALHLLGRGQTMVAPADFFSIGATRQLLANVTSEYEFVVVDTPPLLHRAYASTIINMAQQAVVVVAHGSKGSTAHDLRDRLELIGTPIAGYVYVKAPVRRELIGSRRTEPTDTEPGGPELEPTTATH